MTRAESRDGWRIALKAAFPATVPVLTGFACLGLAYGLLMASKGYGPLWSTLMSAVAFGGSMQYAAIALLTTAFDPLQAFLLSLLVNARHLFYGLGMLERYRGVGRLRPFLVCVLCDETFSIVSAVPPPAGVEPRQFYFWVSFLDYAYWVCATAAGGILGGVLTFNTAGMDFALTALFAVLFLEQWKDPKNRQAGLMGLGGAAAALALFGAKSMVLPAMALVLALLLGERRRLCA